MRIISPFKDYYDNASTMFDTDDTIKYVRTPVEFEYRAIAIGKIQNNIPEHLEWLLGKKLLCRINRTSVLHAASLNDVKVWFCGKIYTGVVLLGWQHNDTKDGYGPEIETYAWTLEQFDTLCRKYDIEVTSILPALSREIQSREKLLERLASVYTLFCSYSSSYFEDLAVKHKIPCAYRISDHGTHQTIHVNAPLRKVNFQKMMSPQQARQELELWWGKQAPDMAPMAKIEDKYKVQEHGFDEWSFRKLPGGQKRRKHKT